MKNKLIVFHKGLEIKLLPNSAKISPNINLPLRLVETCLNNEIVNESNQIINKWAGVLNRVLDEAKLSST